VSTSHQIETHQGVHVLRLISPDGTNRLTESLIQSCKHSITKLAKDSPKALVIAGNEKFFSAGADLNEIAVLDGRSAYEFAKMGQELMQVVEDFPAPTYAAIHGYCMGGGLDLALACHRRLAAPDAVFGHRGAALGLITGWGGTQRLARLIGKARALEMFVAADKVGATRALMLGLIETICDDPVGEAISRLISWRTSQD